MDRPLVSVIIPTYNRPRRLRRAIRSVESQTYEPIELIVVDDGSSPPVSDVLEGSNIDVDRFELVIHEENEGGNASRNTGIDHSSGEYVAFLDDDDRWKAAKLDRQIDRLEAAPESVGLVYTGAVQIDADTTVNAVTSQAIEGVVTRQLLRRNFVGTISSVVIRREAIETVGTLDERFPSWQDWEYYVRLSRQYRFAAIEEPLVVRYNAGAGQLSHGYETKKTVSAPLFREKYSGLASRYGWLCKRSLFGHLEYHLGLAAIRTGNYDASRRHFLTAIGWYPFEPLFYLYAVSVAGGSTTYESLYGLQPYLPIRSLKRLLQ